MRDSVRSEQERRRAMRFPVKMRLRCRTVRQTDYAEGEVLNISSGGVLFRSERDFQPDQRVEVAICWPALLDDCVRLNLVAEGLILRAGAGLAVMRIERYEFRTAPRENGFRRVPCPMQV